MSVLHYGSPVALSVIIVVILHIYINNHSTKYHAIHSRLNEHTVDKIINTFYTVPEGKGRDSETIPLVTPLEKNIVIIGIIISGSI